MTCREAVRRLDAYVDGELDVADTLALDDHLQQCPRCRAALARVEALRLALHEQIGPDRAPERLRAGLYARYAARAREPGIAALALAIWLGWFAPDSRRASEPAPAAQRVVYHISSSTAPAAALRNLANHLRAAPGARIVVVAHNDGVDFLLRGALDEFGAPLEPAVRGFRERGVEFRVCSNTLERRQLDSGGLIPSATLVPSGIAEIGRLQSEEGYV